MLHRPARTLVSVLGIGVGILLIVFTIGLANGTMRERAERDKNVGAEILFMESGSFGTSGMAMRTDIGLKSEIEKVDGVAAAVPFGQMSVVAKEGLTGSRLIDGVRFEEYAAIAGMQTVQGRAFVEGRDEMMSDAAWIERRKLKVGDTFEIYERPFTIVGTYEPSAGSRIKIPLATMQQQVGTDGHASAFLIKVDEGRDAKAVGDALNSKFENKQIIRTSELEELYMQGLPALDVFLNVVIGVAAAISGLIILLTMYTTVTERTRQIGVLKSLGMSNANVGWTIVQEALLITIGGVVFGVLATFGLKLVLARWTTLSVAIDLSVVAMIVGVGALSGIIGALYPGLRAARLDAVEALNYD